MSLPFALSLLWDSCTDNRQPNRQRLLGLALRMKSVLRVAAIWVLRNCQKLELRQASSFALLLSQGLDLRQQRIPRTLAGKGGFHSPREASTVPFTGVSLAWARGTSGMTCSGPSSSSGGLQPSVVAPLLHGTLPADKAEGLSHAKSLSASGGPNPSTKT